MVELVDYWAEWCTPCKMMTPIIEELKKTYAGKLSVTEINVDEKPELSEQAGVMSIPTYVIKKDGQEVARLIGAVGKAPLEEKIKENLS